MATTKSLSLGKQASQKQPSAPGPAAADNKVRGKKPGAQRPARLRSAAPLAFEKRVATLERQVADLLLAATVKKAWQSTMGMWTDDEISRMADESGRESRERVRD